jgi:hypothetical protein
MAFNKESKLTPYERRMVEEMTRTDAGRPRSITEAYCRAYPAKASPITNNNEASKIFNKPHVQAAIAAIEAKLEADRRRASRGNAQAIQTSGWALFNDPEATIDNKINALKLLKSLLPKDQVEDHVLKDSAVSKVELQARLEEIFSSISDKAIDVSPDTTTEQDILAAQDADDIEAEVLSITAEIDTPDEPAY